VIWLGLALALVSALLVNLGLYIEHHASSRSAPLRLRRPLAALWQLMRDPLWLAGYASGWLGWGSYIAALWFAPLSLVQGVAAGGIGVLAVLVRRAGKVTLGRGEQIAVGAALLALVLLAISLGLHPSEQRHRQTPWSVVLALCVLLVVGGVVVAVAVKLANWGSALGAFGGICYAIGDVATKAAIDRDGWLFVALVVIANVAAFCLMQLSFQRGSALATAGVSTVLTNALPIAVALVVFGERLPPGPLGVVRVIALLTAIAAAGVLASTPRTHAEPVAKRARAGC
jgi:hypothetical protein